jgi:hypothetical protein
LDGSGLSWPDGLALPGGLAGICAPAGKSLFLNSPERLAFAGMCARLRTYFLLSRQKKVSKEKATPLSATRSFAAGNLRCGLEAGNRSNSLRSDNRGSFSRPKPTAQAHTEGTQAAVLVALRATLHGLIRFSAVSNFVRAKLFVILQPFDRLRTATPRCNARHSRASSAAPHAVLRRRVAQDWADQGTRLFERSEFERPPAQTEQHSVPEASLRDDAFGSPFFCLLFFGEAKKSKCAVGRMSRPTCAGKNKYINHSKRHSPAGARPGQQSHQKPNKEINSEWTAASEAVKKDKDRC